MLAEQHVNVYNRCVPKSRYPFDSARLVTLLASLDEIRKFFLVIASYYSLSVIMSATSSVKKRKVDIEHRAFNPAWKDNLPPVS